MSWVPGGWQPDGWQPDSWQPEGSAYAVLSGTALNELTERSLRTSSFTIVFTITNDTLVSGASFDAQRQNAIDSLLVSGSDVFGLGNLLSLIDVSNVVRDSDTQYTITVPAFSQYNISQNEVVTGVVPNELLTTGSEDLVATPEFTILDTIRGGGDSRRPRLITPQEVHIRALRREDEEIFLMLSAAMETMYES